MLRNDLNANASPDFGESVSVHEALNAYSRRSFVLGQLPLKRTPQYPLWLSRLEAFQEPTQGSQQLPNLSVLIWDLTHFHFAGAPRLGSSAQFSLELQGLPRSQLSPCHHSFWMTPSYLSNPHLLLPSQLPTLHCVSRVIYCRSHSTCHHPELHRGIHSHSCMHPHCYFGSEFMK